MNMSKYQQLVARTMNKTLSLEQATANYAMGLCGEAGEVSEPLKKHLFHGKSLDVDALAAEMGDVAWYLAALANTLGIDMGEVLASNVEKLKARWPNGFQPQPE